VSVYSVTFPGWSDRIAIAEQSAKIFGQLEQDPVRRGNQMHELLSLIHSTNEAEEALSHYLARNPMEAAEAEVLSTSLRQMLNQPEVARFFQPQHSCKNECSLAWQGEVLRPDRIVFTPDQTWVVDFKTGLPQTSHHAHVLHYCDAIRAMGFPSVKGYLIYIGSEHCQVLPCD
jgi:ATP-dependent exoDNAse (exonuclease V) beta subunit